MNAFFKGAGTVLRKRWAWSLLLVLSMACMVWFLGPLLAVDDHRFWKSPTARLSTISLLFLLWGLAMVIASARHTVRQGKPEHQARNRHQGLVENERRHVRGRFKEALHTLKTTHRYAGRGTGWRRDLPWYLLIGQQGSGKSSLLAASGLQSPLDRREPATPQGTAFCDWYFTDQGVLVETAGRYLSQLDSPVDAAGWAILLGLCKARRRTRPLNGVVVTVSIETLLGSNAHDLNLHARQVHSRLQDIQQVLHVDVPIYLVLTQADHLPGYAEFFDTPLNEGADGVLGAPVVIGKAGADVGVVRQAFEALVQRLSGELITRLHQERSTERRARILDFPLQLAQIGERLCQFIELAFCAHRYQRINGLRGFYLSSTAERRPPFGQGLFARVIFAEADLAGLQRPELRRLRRRQGALAITAVLVVGLAAGLWWHSYSANRQRLEQLAFLAEASTPAQPGADETLALLPLLDNRLASTRVFALAADTHWIERAGLYQGEATRAPLVRAYEEALLQLFLSQVTRLLEAQVRTSLGNREHLLDNLRAYLMLSLPARRDTGWLAQRIAGHWSLRHAGEPAVQARLNEHFSRLLEHPFAARLDEDLIAQARQALRGESLAEVVYRVLREQSRNLEPYRLADGRVFEGLDPPIPGFYGKRYLQYFEKQGPRLVNAIAQDNWVLGEATDLSAMDLRRLMVELQQRYFSEYADAWANALGGIRLRSTEDLKQGAEQLANLTSAQSPLVLMLQQILENTRLLPGNATLETLTHDAGGALGTAIQSRVPEALLGQLPLAGPDDAARRALQRRFEPLHQLLDDQQNPGAELTQVLRQLDALHLQLAALDREGSPEQAAFQLAKRRMEGQQDALSQLRNATTRLPLPIKGWLEGIADDSWRHLLDDAYVYVNQRYQGEVYGLYAKAIRQRYPFNAHAASDVALSDFQEFFKPQGVLARFHDAYLKPFVGIDANRYRLRGLEGRSLPMSRSLLEQLTKAHTVRRSFFSGDQGEWAVRFTLAPYSLDQAVSRATLRVGDQQLEYRHGPIMPLALAWPYEAENGRSSLVLEREAEQPLGIEKNSGAWSLFRFFELMQSEPANGRDRQILKADLAGLRANYLLVSQRTPSPFQMDAWRTFRLPEQL